VEPEQVCPVNLQKRFFFRNKMDFALYAKLTSIAPGVGI
jgi:hypothetical protein